MAEIGDTFDGQAGGGAGGVYARENPQQGGTDSDIRPGLHGGEDGRGRGNELVAVEELIEKLQ